MASSERARRSAPGARIMVGLLAAALLAALAVAVLAHGGRPFGLDRALHHWALVHRSSALTDAGVALADTGTGAPAYALAALTGAAATGSRLWWWRGALVGVVALALAEALRISLSTVIGRARPPREDWAASASGYAFPSGHTTASALIAIALAAALLARFRSPVVRIVAVAVPGLWALGVGVDRVYLRVHWPTDVLGGWLLAAALASFLLPALGRLLHGLSQSPAQWPPRRWRPRQGAAEPAPDADR
ncbi:phosphatase PAP2 family protein [Streptacidiphilus sp. PAMC 29251]